MLQNESIRSKFLIFVTTKNNVSTAKTKQMFPLKYIYV